MAYRMDQPSFKSTLSQAMARLTYEQNAGHTKVKSLKDESLVDDTSLIPEFAFRRTEVLASTIERLFPVGTLMPEVIRLTDRSTSANVQRLENFTSHLMKTLDEVKDILAADSRNYLAAFRKYKVVMAELNENYDDLTRQFAKLEGMFADAVVDSRDVAARQYRQHETRENFVKALRAHVDGLQQELRQQARDLEDRNNQIAGLQRQQRTSSRDDGEIARLSQQLHQAQTENFNLMGRLDESADQQRLLSEKLKG